VRNNSKKYLFLHVKPVLREALLYGRGTRLTCEGLYWWRDGLLLRTKGVARTDVANAARVAKTANFMVVVILLVCSGYDCWDAWVLLAGESMHLHMNYILIRIVSLKNTHTSGRKDCAPIFLDDGWLLTHSSIGSNTSVNIC
jgi:hypothetical protein